MQIKGYRVRPLLKKVGSEIMDDNVLGLAAQAAYYFFFSLFPICLFLAPMLALVGDKRETFDYLLAQLSRTVPAEAFALVRDVLAQVVFEPSAPGLVSVGALLALWSGSNVFSTLQDALNQVYDVARDDRPWWKKKLIAIGCLLGVGVLFVFATLILLSGDDIVAAVGDRIGLGVAGRFAWNLAQFPLALCILAATAFAVYKYLPAARQRNSQVLIASVAMMLVWLVVTLAFRYYVQNFGSYNKTYGAIGGVIVLLTWMYLSMVVLLSGGELASELQKGTGGVRSRAGHLYDGRISTGGPTDLPSVAVVERAPAEEGRPANGSRRRAPPPAAGVGQG